MPKEEQNEQSVSPEEAGSKALEARYDELSGNVFDMDLDSETFVKMNQLMMERRQTDKKIKELQAQVTKAEGDEKTRLESDLGIQKSVMMELGADLVELEAETDLDDKQLDELRSLIIEQLEITNKLTELNGVPEPGQYPTPAGSGDKMPEISWGQVAIESARDLEARQQKAVDEIEIDVVDPAEVQEVTEDDIVSEAPSEAEVDDDDIVSEAPAEQNISDEDIESEEAAAEADFFEQGEGMAADAIAAEIGVTTEGLSELQKKYEELAAMASTDPAAKAQFDSHIDFSWDQFMKEDKAENEGFFSRLGRALLGGTLRQKRMDRLMKAYDEMQLAGKAGVKGAKAERLDQAKSDIKNPKTPSAGFDQKK